MNYLLDTQVLVWALEENSQLKSSWRNIIEDTGNNVLVSQISLMELSIKLKLGKLPKFIISIEAVVTQLLKDGFSLLPLSNQHIFTYQAVPFLPDHRDPFDRFLLATALAEQMPIVSADDKFLLYSPLVTIIS